MDKFDQRIDTYIGLSADNSRPILLHLRRLIHRAAPQISEKIKRRHPHFEYEGGVCHMAAYKDYCTFGFAKASRLADPNNIFKSSQNGVAGQFGKLTSVDDLPADEIIIEYIQTALELNEKEKNFSLIKMIF